MVIFENIGIVVEGKASNLSFQAQRGDVVRLRSDIKGSIEKAWEQGARARSYLMGSSDARFTDEAGNEILVIPQGSVSEVYVVNPTLHSFKVHGVLVRKLRSLGLFSSGETPWSVYINDLRIIVETVRNPAELLCYLRLRTHLPVGDRIFAADELDLFGSFLLREQFEERLKEVDRLMVQATTDFDSFYMGEIGAGPSHNRPRMFSTELVDRFVDRLVRRRPPAWLAAACTALRLSLSEVAALDARAPRLVEEVAELGVSAEGFDHLVLVAYGSRRRWDEVKPLLSAETFSEGKRVVTVTPDYAGVPMITWAEHF